MSLIRLDEVAKYYKTTETVSVGMKKVSLKFDLGEFVAITGESGSGKSTLLNVISGLDGYEEGELYINEEETSHFQIADWENYRARYIGFIFQNYNIIDSYTVYQNVIYALEVQGYPKKDRRKRALELIDRVGLLRHKNHKASKLSGGEKQRTVIARALAKDCPIIVCDEPTGNLDSESAKIVMELLHELSKDKLIIVVTHDFSQVEEYATRKIKMHDGLVSEDKVLKKHRESTDIKLTTIKKFNLPLLTRFALRNLFSAPKRLIFVLLLQLIISFVYILNYSSNLASIRNQQSLGYSSFFPTVPESRILIEKRDRTLFSDEDITYLNSLNNVNGVYRHGNNFHNTVSDMELQTGNEFNLISYYVSKTDTANRLSSSDLHSGRLPVNENEVVYSYYGAWQSDIVSQSLSLVVGVYDEFIGYKYETIGTFTVVGYAENMEATIFFHDDYLNKPYTRVGNEPIFASISIISLKAGDKIINDIDQTKYRVIFPSSANENPFSFILEILIYIFLVFFGLLLYLILHAVMKNVMNARKKEFAIYRSIGSNKVTLARLVVLEQIILVLISYTLSIMLFFTLSLFVDSFKNIVLFLEVRDYVLLFIFFLVFGTWLGLRFNKKVFNQSVIETISQSREE